MANWMNTPGYPYTPNDIRPIYNQMYGTPNDPMARQPLGIIWVDGEVGAKAYQMPQGWPINTPIPLWDSNDKMIYLKSTNQMGMPNPLQKIRYTFDEQQTSGYLPVAAAVSETNYVTKEDLAALKNEIKEMLRTNQQGRNQNNNQNRAGGST